MADVAERCVVVTGAASGIGLAVTEMLLERWPGVVVGAIDLEGDPLTELGSHSGVAAVPCDVSDRAQVRSAVALFAEQVPVVGLVNGAGNHHAGASVDLEEAGWRSVLGVHLDGSFFVAQAVATAMISTGTGGSIVNISSVAKDFAWPGRLPYAVAKAGIGSLTRTLAVEWAEHGIRINAVAPGYVDTPMVRNAAVRGAFDVQERIDGHALKRFAQPDEIAEVIEFLLSDRASFITGEVIRADGGFSIFK